MFLWVFCFPKSRVNENGDTVTLPGCRVSRDRQACFVNWFCSSYSYISTKETDFNRFLIFLNDLRIFDRSKFFLVTQFSVTSLLVTRYFVALFSNTRIIVLLKTTTKFRFAAFYFTKCSLGPEEEV